MNEKVHSSPWIYRTLSMSPYISKLLREHYKKQLSEYYEERKEMARRASRMATIRRHIVCNNLVWYCTFTLTPEKQGINEKTLTESLRKMLTRKKLKYYIVKEYGKKNNTLHFHGFISANDDMVNSGRRDRFGNAIYNYLPLQENYGYTFCTLLPDNWQKQKIIKYIIKYAIKETNQKALYTRISPSINWVYTNLSKKIIHIT